MRCTYCGKNTHTIENCPGTWSGSENRMRMRCSYCGAKDHNVAACPKTFVGNAARKWDSDSVASDFILDGKKR